MKILYFGTVCDLDHYYDFLEGSKYIPSVAPVVFESALLGGIYQNGVEAEIHSYPMIPTFPASKHLYFGNHTEKLSCGYTCRWLKTLNIPILKQVTRRNDAKKMLRRWLKENSDNGAILTYSIPPFLIKTILKYASKYSVKVIPVVTDLLRDMYVNDSHKSTFSIFKNLYLKNAIKLQGECDGYIYLTEAMRDVVAPSKPYMVMEGIADIDNVSFESSVKAVPRAVMYAGALYEKYGIINLIKAFELIDNPDTELWIFGDGSAVSEIKKISEQNSRIKYFGSLPREKILEYEKKSVLLVNPRDPNEEFTKYSFPSKTIEYMLSGTPLLTTRLYGIPEEYFDYVFCANNNSVESLAAAIDIALQYSNEELEAMGRRAQKFIVENKNAKCQAEKIIRFISSLN